MVVVGGLATLSVAVPAPAWAGDEIQQGTRDDSLRTAAANLNARTGELFRKKDVSGFAALYTKDALFVELLPRLMVMNGQAQVQQHLRNVMAGNATDYVPTVTDAHMTADGTMAVGGDYYLAVGNSKRIAGHFFQILRQEGGSWKIAVHSFARPEAVTAMETRQYNEGSGG